ncbi:hypothetical protein C8Q79DRAFT_8149 [Trametes meyenii]|nr:hypothetical protein C8Q79DRAFT_8149 [Trametes meyenii]
MTWEGGPWRLAGHERRAVGRTKCLSGLTVLTCKTHHSTLQRPRIDERRALRIRPPLRVGAGSWRNPGRERRSSQRQPLESKPGSAAFASVGRVPAGGANLVCRTSRDVRTGDPPGPMRLPPVCMYVGPPDWRCRRSTHRDVDLDEQWSEGEGPAPSMASKPISMPRAQGSTHNASTRHADGDRWGLRTAFRVGRISAQTSDLGERQTSPGETQGVGGGIGGCLSYPPTRKDSVGIRREGRT